MEANEIASREIDVAPGDKAWKVIRGGYDLHLHVTPNVSSRRIDDLATAREFAGAGLAGFVLKSPYFVTAGLATAVSEAIQGVVAFGAITLNHSVGGLNPVAVELAGRAGARLVCMPTCDALNEAEWCSRSTENVSGCDEIQHELKAKGILPSPLTVLGEDDHLNPRTLQCIDLIAEYEMALCTGHLGRKEIFPLVKAAKEAGVARLIVTDAEYPSQNLSAGEQVELAEMGAVIEHCFITAHTGKVAWHTLFANVAAVGAERSLLSTGLGQRAKPPVSSGLASYAQRFLDAGFSANDVRMMVVENPTRLMNRTEGDG